MNAMIIRGDILEAKEQYVCHQCNAVSSDAGGLAASLFKKFSYSDIYSKRIQPFKPGPGTFPGEIIIKGNGQDQRYIVNMLAQYYPGSPRYPESALDGFKARESYFYKCLNKLAALEADSIAFPWMIGCGLAGGDWKHYFGMINSFAKYMYSKQGTKVVIYQREQDAQTMDNKI